VRAGPLTYDDCVSIVAALQATEGGVNLLNQYTSPRLRAWAPLLRAYERDGVALGEGAHRLQQLVQYTMYADEGPGRVYPPSERKHLGVTLGECVCLYLCLFVCVFVCGWAGGARQPCHQAADGCVAAAGEGPGAARCGAPGERRCVSR
jgi:hypothetical protein